MTYLALSAVFVGLAAVVAALAWRRAPNGHARGDADRRGRARAC